MSEPKRGLCLDSMMARIILLTEKEVVVIIMEALMMEYQVITLMSLIYDSCLN